MVCIKATPMYYITTQQPRHWATTAEWVSSGSSISKLNKTLTQANLAGLGRHI